jgi:hypothetical protein
MELNPEDMSDEEMYDQYGIGPGNKGLRPRVEGHLLVSALQDRAGDLIRKASQSTPTPRHRRK